MTLGSVCTLSLSSLLVLAGAASAEDWPQWRGPHRNGISKETGWNPQWPAAGPKQLWSADKLGVGLSSFSVANGRVHTMGNINDTDHVWCFDAETGAQKWKHPYACEAKDPNGYHGTRSTPTLDGERVFTLSRHGHLFCLNAANGEVIWAKTLGKDFGGVMPKWGYAGSPLIEKGWVLVEPGGQGTSVVALDKASGALVWKNGNDGAGYSSLIAFDLEGERCFAQFAKDQLIARRMKDGSELWRQEWETSYGVNAATPIIEGDKVFVSSGYNYGCALFQVSLKEAKQLWKNKNMRTHVNSCVLVGGHLYGYDDNTLKCLDFQTGEVKWSTGEYGKGSLMLADGKLILYGQQGKLGTAEANPDSFKQISSAQVMAGKDLWAAPVLANGRIYCRAGDKMACFDVKGK